MMKKWKTSSGIEIFQVLNQRSNSYLICSENGNILVDTGRVSAFNQLKKNIDSINIRHTKIDFLILTHTHYDHCQNAFAIKKHSDCKIIMSEFEAQYSKSGYTPLPDGTFPITRLIVNLGRRFGPEIFGYQSFVADMLVARRLDLKSLNVSIIYTGGHSAGSVSVIVDHEIAIVGDALYGAFANSVMPPFADDLRQMVESWGRLLETDCRIFLPGHGYEISRELLQKEFDKYIVKYNLEKND